jgi:hypothetical protein
MRWVIEAKITDAQGCVERARDIFEDEFRKCDLDENKGSSNYEFSHVELGDIGRLKITALPSDQTEFYGYDPALPTPRWLVEYLLRNTVPDQLSPRLQALLKGYVRQIEQGIFEPSADQLYHWAFSGEKVDLSFDQEGLADFAERKRAEDDFEQWRIKLREMRKKEFDSILDVIETEIRQAPLAFWKWENGTKIYIPARSDTASNSSQESTGSTLEPAEPAAEEPVAGEHRIISERTEALNKLAVLWVKYNQMERISKNEGKQWFLEEYCKELGLPYVSVDEFNRHLPKAYRAGVIGKDPTTGKYIPKLATRNE